MLDRLADCNAPINHGLIVREVEHEEIPFVPENLCDFEGTLLTDRTVGQMQVGQCLVVLDALSKQLRTVLPDPVVVQEELCEEPLILKGLGE